MAQVAFCVANAEQDFEADRPVARAGCINRNCKLQCCVIITIVGLHIAHISIIEVPAGVDPGSASFQVIPVVCPVSKPMSTTIFLCRVGT